MTANTMTTMVAMKVQLEMVSLRARNHRRDGAEDREAHRLLRLADRPVGVGDVADGAARVAAEADAHETGGDLAEVGDRDLHEPLRTRRRCWPRTARGSSVWNAPSRKPPNDARHRWRRCHPRRRAW